jgi:predicted flap endonuclease-1-like 5' DNA nuclease
MFDSKELIELATEMIVCLSIAALLGGLIGYILGKLGCKKENKKRLDDYGASAEVDNTKAFVDTTDFERELLDKTPEANMKVKRTINHGTRPLRLQSETIQDRDNLREISGIGLKIESTLNELGIYKFSQIADWDRDNIDWIEDQLDNHGRVNREDWIAQAKLLAAGGTTEFSKRIRKAQKD